MKWWKGLRTWWGSNRVNIEDRFELIREAAAGTMSRFYMARDRSSDQIVGLKILDPEKTKNFESRFSRLDKPSEGEIASTFSHPCIVKTLEYGETTTGDSYLLMEYLEGQGMNTLIHAQGEEFECYRHLLLSQIVSALVAVHDAGYIHRDICPRNFIVGKDGSTIKLIDFGLSIPNQPAFCQPGNRTGTPLYMSPEIVRRRATDIRVDIFSFGVTAYEMYAASLPWPGSVVTGKAAMEHDKPPIPIKNHCPGINPKLAQIIHRCLEAEPSARPETMAEVQAVISEAVEKTV